MERLKTTSKEIKLFSLLRYVCGISFVLLIIFLYIYLNEDGETHVKASNSSLNIDSGFAVRHFLSDKEKEHELLGLRNSYIGDSINFTILNNRLGTDESFYQFSATKVPNKVNSHSKIVDKSQNKHATFVSPASKNKKVIYLTFDDGPNYTTGKLLHLLKKYDAKATFFMIEPHMKAYPNSVKKMVKYGHSVGMHSVTHNVKRVYKSATTFKNEMLQGQKTLKKITGKKSHLIRAPYGSVPYVTKPYRTAIEKVGLIMWDWTIDSNDWRTHNGVFVNNVKLQFNQCPKNQPIVILMHEKETTVNNLEPLLKYYKKKGYRFEGLTEQIIPIQFH